MANSELPFDPTGCKVTQVNWPARDFQLLLAGKTSDGQSVDAVVLTFVKVVNRYELQQFLQFRRYIERNPGWTNNKVADYPLRLPAKLTRLQASETMSGSCFDDEDFREVYGDPPKIGQEQRLCLFALAEKRFKDRMPYPIVFERLKWTDPGGKLLGGVEEPPVKRWSKKKCEQLGRQFFEAVVQGELDVAWQMLSKSCVKRLKRKKFDKLLKEFYGYADFARKSGHTLKQLRPALDVNVEEDDEIVWDCACCVSTSDADFPRDSVRGYLDLCSGFLRESLSLFVVEEDGEPRLYM